MTEAPKKIMAWSEVAPSLAGSWSVTRYPENAAPYILAAEHDRIVAEKDAEIARLTRIIVEMAIPLEALRMIGDVSGDINGEIVNATNLARAVAAHAALGESND